MNYRAVMLTRKGGPEVLEVVEMTDPELKAGEVRLRVLATGVGGTDVTMRRGKYLFAPPLPFVPGYEVVGEVVEVGPGVPHAMGWTVGQRAAAILVYGGTQERLVVRATELVPVPDSVDPGVVAALVLNYVTAYQAIHRTAKVKQGDTVLVTGANGGVGTAMVELLRLADTTVIAAGSGREATLDARAPDLGRRVRDLEPKGVDVAFDNLGGRYPAECVRATRRGGTVVGVGFSAAPARFAWLRGMSAIFVGAPLSGRRGRFYGITMEYRKDPAPFREDLTALLKLLQSGAISPRIHARLPLLEARRAHEMLERGGLFGKIVLVA